VDGGEVVGLLIAVAALCFGSCSGGITYERDGTKDRCRAVQHAACVRIHPDGRSRGDCIDAASLRCSKMDYWVMPREIAK
jgi:hypothetical protein